MLQIRTMAQLLNCDAFVWKGKVNELSIFLYVPQAFTLSVEVMFATLGMVVPAMRIIECTDPLRNGI